MRATIRELTVSEINSVAGGLNSGSPEVTLTWNPSSPDFHASVQDALHQAYPQIASLNWDSASPTWQADLRKGLETAFPNIKIV